MAHQIAGIDHVLIRVADPQTAHDAFLRLGFLVSPPLKNAERGTETRFLAFEGDHVELFAEEGGPAGAAGPAAKLTGVGLSCRDLDASVQSLRRTGVEPAAAATRTCKWLGSDGAEVCSCATSALTDGDLPGLSAYLCHHPNFTAVRRDQWRGHPNTAQKIVSLTVLLDNPEAAIAGYNRLFGPAASTPTDETVTVHTGRGMIFLVTASGFDDLHPSLDVRLPPPPATTVLTIGVADIAKTAEVLAANGVRAQLRGGQLGVPAEDSLGIGLEFVQI